MSDAEKLLLRLLLDSGTLEVEARKMLGLPAAPAEPADRYLTPTLTPMGSESNRSGPKTPADFPG